MQRLNYTLVSDGTSDRALLPILSWLLRGFCGSLPIQPALADLRRLRNPPRSLVGRIERGIELYPCDLLFVHRDAEGAAFDDRQAEIRAALSESMATAMPAVCIVPVRMSEAWLLIDESALRHAAGNPNGSVPLDLPSPHRLEQLPDPKRVLHEVMRRASGLRGRRLASFNRRLHRARVADWIDDFSALYLLSAFMRLSADLKQVVTSNGWRDPHTS